MLFAFHGAFAFVFLLFYMKSVPYEDRFQYYCILSTIPIYLPAVLNPIAVIRINIPYRTAFIKLFQNFLKSCKISPQSTMSVQQIGSLSAAACEHSKKVIGVGVGERNDGSENGTLLVLIATLHRT